MPSGGTALRSTATRSVLHANRAAFGSKHDAGGPGGEDDRASVQRGRINHRSRRRRPAPAGRPAP